MSKWEKVRLENVCEILDSQRIPITASKRVPGKFPYYGANGVQDYIDDYIFDDELVLLAEDGGNFGSKTKPIAYRVSGKCWVNNHAHVLKAKKDIDIDFLCYSIMFYDVLKIISGTTRKKLNQAQMRKMEIPLPPLDEQCRIAKTLDAAAELLRLRKQQLAELDQLVKSRFVEMFGDLGINENNWPLIKLINACKGNNDIKCGPFGTQLNKAEYQNTGVAVWGIPQINSFFAKKPTDYITGEKAMELDAYSLCSGDIAMSRKGNVGMCALFPVDFPKGIIHSDVLRIRVDPNIINSKFLMYQLHYSPKVQTQIGTVSSGAIMAGINVTKLKGITVHSPPLSLQTQFAEFVQKVEVSKALVQQSIDETQALFDSLMSEFFE